jgi:hypothetical protein
MERPIWGPDERVTPPRKMYELPVLLVRDHRYYRSEKVLRIYELPVRDRYYRWMAEGGVEYELPVLPTGTTGGDWYYR